MRQVREPSTEERRFFNQVSRLLESTKPVVSRRGTLDGIELPLGAMFVSASGALMVKPKVSVLSEDRHLSHRRQRERAPDVDELAMWNRVQTCLETAQPALQKSGTLGEILLPYGEIRVGPLGLVVV